MAQIPNPFPVPLLTQFKNRSASVEKDAKIVNGYGEGLTKEAPEMRKRYGTLPIETLVVIKRPGYSSGVLWQAGLTQGVSSYSDGMVAVFNNRLFINPNSYFDIDAGGLPVDFE